ncbi:MAG: hypothetical protein CMG55_05805 [Candidatus Marinimicrobia bacterium]|nr:hypothetical protein [Candidatus Neomarinimicrobiota bacterium]|tara:strand:- start:19708 stop:20940 length:1233 start_codon:yes stop_codon:yes gene_type:complete
MFRLLKNKTFLLFFIGNITSLIGFGVNLIAISWMVLEESGSEYLLGKIMASATAPGLLLAIFAGLIIDKVNRKWLLVFLDIFRMFVIISFLYYLLNHGFKISLLYPVALFMGLGNSLFWPTAQAFVQELVSDKDYFNANKLLSASYQVGSILGAGIGGVIVHIYSPIIALWVNIITYFFSAIFISLAPFQRKKSTIEEKSLYKSMIKGFSYLKGRSDVLILGLTTILSDVAIWGSLSVLTITISKEVFQKGSLGYGIMDGFYGIGALLSTILVGIVLSKFGKASYLMFCYAVAGFMCLFSPIMANIYFAGVAYFIMGLHNNSARIIVRTIFMENIPNYIMGRVQTILGVYTRAMVILSSLYAGWAIEYHNISLATYFTFGHFTIALLGVFIIQMTWKNGKNIFLKVSYNA